MEKGAPVWLGWHSNLAPWCGTLGVAAWVWYMPPKAKLSPGLRPDVLHGLPWGEPPQVPILWWLEPVLSAKA